MLPIKDLNPTKRFPIINIMLIAINVIVYFVFQASLAPQAAYDLASEWAVVPVLIVRDFNSEAVLDIIRAMFMHGSIAHLGGNMLYLWIFGDNLEDRLGIPLYLAFYFTAGAAATFAQINIDPTSQVPMLGASGAIAGVLGGYLVMFPQVRVRGLIFLGRFARLADVSAIWVLGFWFLLQVLEGLASIGGVAGGGVAFFAHIGGFIAGVVMMFIYLRINPQPPATKRRNLMYQRHDPQQGRADWF